MSTRKITEGEAVGINWWGRGHVDVLALPKCDKDEGFHYCGTHPKEVLQNNITASGHFENPGKHVEVWVCNEHGPEVP